MKITYLDQYFNTPVMPGGSRAFEMSRRLVAAGHTVNVVTSYRSDDRGRHWFTAVEEGVTVYWYPVPYANTMNYSKRMTAFFKFAWAGSRKAASLDADIIFATSTPLTIAIPGAYAAWRQEIPMVFEVRDLWPEMPIAVGALKNPFLIKLARLLERFAYWRASYVVALSPGMADGVADTGFPRHRIRIIPNSCDLDCFSPDESAGRSFRTERPELGDGPIVLYAGTLGRINGVDYLASLADGMLKIRPDVRFVVLGDGYESEKIRTLAKDLGVLNINFFQYRRVPKQAIMGAFSAASIITSLFAPIPQMEKNSANKFFDGLAAGRPVAINHGGWQAELLRDSEAGLVLSRDPDAAALQLAEYISDPERLNKAGRAARELGKTRFARDQLALQLENVLLAAVADKRSRQ